MPTLDWIGKKAVINHHREVPYRLIHCDGEQSAGDPDAGNLLVQGDNLEALKALLPYYAGKIKCIYIDPPYNTGNEKWRYNDNVNSPEVIKWLGELVGKEAEDLSRHDKWLCMMLPRLRLLKDFLRQDGSIVISISDVEVARMRLLCDEIFGISNFVTTICWQNIYTVKNSAKHISGMHDFLLIYARNKPKFERNLRPREDDTDEDYSNPDNDPNGDWISHALQSRNYYSKGEYKITCPGGRLIEGPPDGTYWRTSEDNLWKLDREKKVWWGLKGNNSPRIKEYLKDAKEGVVPVSWWSYKFAGTNSDAKTQLRDMLGAEGFFDTPKPVQLIERVIDLVCDADSIVLDAFAGSGTTGHAVLKRNKVDGGSRSFILIETIEDVATKTTAPRLKKAVGGYQSKKKDDIVIKEFPITIANFKSGGKIIAELQHEKDVQSKNFDELTIDIKEDRVRLIANNGGENFISGLGSGFKYCTLGVSLFDEFGDINASVTFPDLAAHIFFSETGAPIPHKAKGESSFIGTHKEKAVYLLFSAAEQGIAREAAGNVLTPDMLAQLPPVPDGLAGQRIVYGEGCTVSADRLKAEGVTFKQIPYQIEAN